MKNNLLDKIDWQKNHTGIRYYQNKDIILFTALKVASRYCDSYFYNNNLRKVKEIHFGEHDDNWYSKPSLAHSNDNEIQKDILLNNIKKGTEKRKLIFLYRNPIERYIGTLTHFFSDFLKSVLFDFERYPLKDNKEYFKILRSMDEDGQRKIDESRRDLPQSVKDSITDELFEEVHSTHKYFLCNNFTSMENFNGDVGLELLRKTHDRDITSLPLSRLAHIFLNYESSRVLPSRPVLSESADMHYSSYIKSYNKIINDNNYKNISIIDIDNTMLGEFLGVPSAIDKGKGDYATPLGLKNIIRFQILKDYRLKQEIEQKLNKEFKALTQLKLWNSSL